MNVCSTCPHPAKCRAAGKCLLHPKHNKKMGNKKPKSYAKDTTVASPYMAANDGTMRLRTGVDYNM